MTLYKDNCRAHHLLRAELVEKQKGKCAICKAKVPLVVDHCHDCGHIRALLCGHCNRGIAFLKDSPKIMTAARRYVFEHLESEEHRQELTAALERRRLLRAWPKPDDQQGVR